MLWIFAVGPRTAECEDRPVAAIDADAVEEFRDARSRRKHPFTGKPLGPSTIAKGQPFKILRHRFGTWISNDPNDTIREARDLMGHASVETTQR